MKGKKTESQSPDFLNRQVNVLPDFSTAKLTVCALPALAAHADAIFTGAVDTGVGVAARVQRRRRRGGGGGGAYVDHPTDEHRPQ